MDREQIIAAKERAEKATEGPWEASRSGNVYQSAPFDFDRFDTLDTQIAVTKESVKDGEFIAAARTDVPALADALLRVLDLHQPHEETGKCMECTPAPYSQLSKRWPCATVWAIREASDG